MVFWWLRKRTDDARVADLLETCLARIQRGEATVESCCAAFPDEAEQLQPLLLTALATRAVFDSAPSSAAYARMRQRVLAATQPRPMPARRRPIWQPAMAAGLALAFLALLAVPLTALQSSGAVPGDWDYGLKRAEERVRLAVTVDDADRRAMHYALVKRRQEEIETLLAQNRPEFIPEAVRAASVELTTIQESLNNGKAISLPEMSQIAALSARQERLLNQVVTQAPAPVAEVARQGRETAVQTREAAIQAAAQRDPQAAEQIAQNAAAVASASPTPAPQARQNSPSPSPSASPSPSPTPAASPTPTPTPSTTPTPSATPSPSPSPSPTPAPMVTPAPAPTLPPLTVAPAPTSTPSVPLTPAPQPTPTPRPAPPSTAPAPALPVPTTAPLPPGAVLPGQLTPTPAPTPTPATAAGGAGTRSSTTVPAPGVTLEPGRPNEFVYTGPPVPLLALLAPAQGRYTTVGYRNPGGAWTLYKPGDAGGAALLVLPGSTFSIIVTDEVRLSW